MFTFFRRMSAHRKHRRSGNSGRKMAAHLAEMIPNIVAQVHETLNPTSRGGANSSRCTIKHFNSCNPPKFNGSEGATGLLQWYEGMENTFLNSDCPDDKRVQYATSVFQKRALTWWNGVKRTRGLESAMAMLWAEFKDLMRREFCPRNEVMKLETEFWELKQNSGDNLGYTNRFQELSLLVPHMVTPYSRAIEKYIRGLPMQIQDSVWSRNPSMLEDAIRLAVTLTDNHVKEGTLTRKGEKKTHDKAATESNKEVKAESSKPRKKKQKKNTQTYAITTPAPQQPLAIPPVFPQPLQAIQPVFPQAPGRKPYTGPHPLCNRCTFHHPATSQCRQCTVCGRLGHLANTCKLAMQPQAIQPLAAQPMVQPAIRRACFNCGDPNHFRDACPRLVIVNNAQANQAYQGAQGRAFNINANQAQANNEVVNGTFLVNNRYASILFDTGADKSFVSIDFEPLLATPRVKLVESFTVEVADGKPVTLNSIINNCTLNLNEHQFPIDLIPMQLGSFDIIVCMDWLAKNHAEIVCFEKCIRIPLEDGQTLKVYGEKPSSGLKLMSCTKAQKYLRKKYVAFLAHIVKKDKERKIEDIPIIREFTEVFPDDVSGLPPVRQVPSTSCT